MTWRIEKGSTLGFGSVPGIGVQSVPGVGHAIAATGCDSKGAADDRGVTSPSREARSTNDPLALNYEFDKDLRACLVNSSNKSSRSRFLGIFPTNRR